MSTPLQPVLIIYSHGRNPPLHPPPHLRYDLRNIPNPPKELRAVSDGRSKRIREHLLSEPKFVQRLEAVERDILRTMEAKIAEHAAQLIGSELEECTSVDVAKEEEEGHEDESRALGAEQENEELSEASSSDHEVILRVGCNCALGHHRSVAFVEELSRRSWPKEWQVLVVHRDLEKKRAGGARKMQKASFREKRRNMWEE